MNELKKVIYNCRKATYLMDKKLIDTITFRETVELRIHLLGCNVCRTYMEQSQKINQIIKQLLIRPQKPEITLDEEYKDNLRVQIEERLNRN